MHELYIRYSAEEKETIVLSVKRSELSIVQALKRLGIPRRTFYNWYQKCHRRFECSQSNTLQSTDNVEPHT